MNDPKCDHLIRWSPSGTSFLVLDEDEFSKTLIPDLFKHNNYASFVRQLNMYGFHKVVGLADGSLKTSEQRSKPPSEYKNDFFVRGMPDLMWLIQKPKNTTKRSKGRKKGKAEDSDDDGGSDREMMPGSGIIDESGQLQSNGGGLIEAPPTQHVQPAVSKNQFEQIIQQLDQLRAHQQVMTNAINRLRKDHTQLYEQSIAFQTLHDRHENSISAILTFLATVYDKSIAGHLNGQTLQNLFQGAVDQSQNAGQVMSNPGSAVANMGRAGVVGMGNGQQRTPFKRRPLMLPPVPHGGGAIPVGGLKEQNGNTQNQQQQQQQQQQSATYNTYQSPSIQELFTPTSGRMSPGPGSPEQSNSQLNSAFFPGLFAMQGQQNDNNMHAQQALTPRQLTRAITPLLRVAEQQRQIAQHNKKVAEAHSGIDQMAALQDQQNENINRLMEIVGPYTTTRETTPIRPISSVPTSPSASGVVTPAITAATVSPVVTPAIPTAVVSTDGPSAPVAPATAGESAIAADEDVVRANNGALHLHQTPSPSATNNYALIPPPPGGGMGTNGDSVGLAGGDTPGDFVVDLDSYLHDPTDWPGMEDYQTGVDDGIPGATQSLSEVNLDPTLFEMEPGFGSGYMGSGLHGMGGMGMGARSNGLGLGGLGGQGMDSMGQILGTNPSTAVGSPQSPAFSDGTASLIDGSMGNIEESLTGNAKKKRRMQ